MPVFSLSCSPLTYASSDGRLCFRTVYELYSRVPETPSAILNPTITERITLCMRPDTGDLACDTGLADTRRPCQLTETREVVRLHRV